MRPSSLRSVTIKVDLFSMCKRGWTGQKCTEKVVELPDPGAQPPQSPAKCITGKLPQHPKYAYRS